MRRTASIVAIGALMLLACLLSPARPAAVLDRAHHSRRAS